MNASLNPKNPNAEAQTWLSLSMSGTPSSSISALALFHSTHLIKLSVQYESTHFSINFRINLLYFSINLLYFSMNLRTHYSFIYECIREFIEVRTPRRYQPSVPFPEHNLCLGGSPSIYAICSQIFTYLSWVSFQGGLQQFLADMLCQVFKIQVGPPR